MRICLLGPTYPFRGGIAHHTTLLCHALRHRHNVKFISFKRQYPGWLFPGRTDKDTSRAPVRAEDVEYSLDSINPLTWRRTAKAVVAFDPELFVVPWWVSFWAPHFFYIIRYVKRYLRTKVTIVCHNVFEHEPSLLKSLAARAVLSQADRLITHSEVETQRLKKMLGDGINVTTGFHPTYADLKKGDYSREQAKTKLGLSGYVLLFFGFVREYKGLHILLEAMPKVLRQKPVTLLIAGEFWKDKKKYVDQIRRLRIDQQVRIVDEYIPNERIALYFSAADLVVLPYLSVTGSGVVHLAYGFDRPVIATRVGALSEVIRDGGNGRLVAPGDVEALGQAIIESLEPSMLSKYAQSAERVKTRFSWERMADLIAREESRLTEK